MCGIAIVFGRKHGAVQTALEAMVCAQVHRGPDDQGLELIPCLDGILGLGQRRLSILDLSPLGHQPMTHPATGDVLVYNGELYNYETIRRELESLGETFRGRSDTEIMLHALVRWGPEVLQRFRGMYSIAWYRRATQSLLLARDPLGIKPLYYSHAPGMFCAASEVRAVVASGLVDRTLNQGAIASMLAYGAVQDPETIFKSIRSFPAGSWCEIELDSPDRSLEPVPVRYWRPPDVDPTMTEADAIDRTRSALDAAVKSHLVSDVPVGVFLSSGLDSTIVAHLAARHVSDIRTYTVGFAENPDLSESPMAARTAAIFGLPHHDVQISGIEALASAERWLASLDQPSVDGLNTYIVSGAVKQAGLTVALSGLGGDELFCGYSSFADVPRLLSFMQRVSAIPSFLRVLLARLAAVGRSSAYRQKLMEIAQGRAEILDLYFQRRRIMSNHYLRALGINAASLGLSRHMLPIEATSSLELPEDDPVVATSILETLFYCGNMLLRDSDANGMAHSLEIRVPFFDTDVLNAIMPIPASRRMPTGRPEKHLLRASFREALRPELLSLTKRGFSLPIRRWMVGPLRPLCEASLDHLKNASALDPKGIDQIWNAFLAEPETPIWSRAFALCILGSYIRNATQLRPVPSLTHSS